VHQLSQSRRRSPRQAVTPRRAGRSRPYDRGHRRCAGSASSSPAKNFHARHFHHEPDLELRAAAYRRQDRGLGEDSSCTPSASAAGQGGMSWYLGDGSWTKRLHPGWGAHAGVVATRLAGGGFTGPGGLLRRARLLRRLRRRSRGRASADAARQPGTDLGDPEPDLQAVSRGLDRAPVHGLRRAPAREVRDRARADRGDPLPDGGGPGAPSLGAAGRQAPARQRIRGEVQPALSLATVLVRGTAGLADFATGRTRPARLAVAGRSAGSIPRSTTRGSSSATSASGSTTAASQERRTAPRRPDFPLTRAISR
jgi:hypothetical protein